MISIIPATGALTGGKKSQASLRILRAAIKTSHPFSSKKSLCDSWHLGSVDDAVLALAVCSECVMGSFALGLEEGSMPDVALVVANWLMTKGLCERLRF